MEKNKNKVYSYLGEYLKDNPYPQLPSKRNELDQSVKNMANSSVDNSSRGGESDEIDCSELESHPSHQNKMEEKNYVNPHPEDFQPIVHYMLQINDYVSYICNPSVHNRKKEKITQDLQQVTCKNCIRTLKFNEAQKMSHENNPFVKIQKNNIYRYKYGKVAAEEVFKLNKELFELNLFLRETIKENIKLKDEVNVLKNIYKGEN